MSETIESRGQCLCGAVGIKASSMSTQIGVCHCNMCRQWGGGPYLAVDCSSNVQFTGEEQIGLYSSSEWAERGFCKRCGTHLFYRIKANQQHIMPIGLFDDETQLCLDHQIFIDEKPAYYDFAQQTSMMTGAEVFAQFAPPSD